MSRVSTHVLDNTVGQPARGVPVSLYRVDPGADGGRPPGEASLVGSAVTDGDGRVGQFEESGEPALAAGIYRLVFDTGAYFASSGQRAFYPEVTISFVVDDADGHYHVPLLLSPFAYATYRGS